MFLPNEGVIFTFHFKQMYILPLKGLSNMLTLLPELSYREGNISESPVKGPQLQSTELKARELQHQAAAPSVDQNLLEGSKARGVGLSMWQNQSLE